MANQFIARKGLIALADSQITGSLNISQNIVAGGTVQATFDTSTATAISGAFDSVSSSLATRIASQEAFSSSLDATFATDSQVATAVAGLNAASSSYLQNTTDTFTGTLNVDGNVGIGTTSANGRTQIYTDRYNDSLTFNATAGFILGGSIRQLSINTNDTSPYNISFQGKTNANTSANIVFQSLGGFVGIGETNPEKPLHIKADQGSSGIRIERTSATTTGAHGQIGFSSVNGIVSGIHSLADGDSNGGHLVFNTTTTTPQLDVFSLEERMRIKSDGNVGIGTNNPRALLEIAKNAGADPSPVDDPVTLRLTDSGNAATGAGDTTNPWAEIQFYSEDASSGGPAVQAKIATIYDDIYSAGSHIAFYNTATPTNGLSENVRITSIGRVGIGVSVPSTKLHVEDNVNGEVAVRIHNAASDVGSTAALTIDTTGNNFAIRQYPDADTSNANKTEFVTTAGGGHMTFTAGGAEKIRISSNGLTFNGDTAAANALDDYEEGTWTPSIIRHNGTIAASYTALSSYFTYVKIGRLVYIKGFVNSLTDGSSNGSSYWTIKGLPFTGTQYAGMLLGYKNLPADGIYIGDAGGQIIFTLGAAPYSGTWGSGREFMLAFVYETNS